MHVQAYFMQGFGDRLADCTVHAYRFWWQQGMPCVGQDDIDALCTLTHTPKHFACSWVVYETSSICSCSTGVLFLADVSLLGTISLLCVCADVHVG